LAYLFTKAPHCSSFDIFQVYGFDLPVDTAGVFLEDALDKRIDFLYGRPIHLAFKLFPLLDAREFDQEHGGPGTLAAHVAALRDIVKCDPPMQFYSIPASIRDWFF